MTFGIFGHKILDIILLRSISCRSTSLTVFTPLTLSPLTFLLNSVA